MPDSQSLTVSLAFGLAVFLVVRLARLVPRHPFCRSAVMALVALTLAGLSGAPVWRALPAGYPEDSFATLSPTVMAGLAGLSLILIGLLFTLSLAKARWLARIMVPVGGKAWLWPADLTATLALAYLALWLAPQAYYLYYLTVFEGLPWHSVIKPPPGPGAFAAVLLLAEPPSLSSHLQGLTARALLLASATRPFLALVDSAARARSPGLGAGLLAGGLHAAGSAILTGAGF